MLGSDPGASLVKHFVTPKLLCILLAAAWAIPTDADPVTTRFSFSFHQAEEGERRGAARLRLVPDVTPREELYEREIEAEIPGWVSLDLPAGSGWRATVTAEGYWIEPRRVAVGTQPATVPLVALPAGYLRGRVEVPSHEVLPEGLEVRLEHSEDRRGGHRPFVTCPLADGRFLCPVPAGRLDLRLGAPGFVALYSWGVDIGRRETEDLGVLKLRPGASVVGWVQIPDPSIDSQDPTVELLPVVAGRAGRGEGERHAAVALETSTNRRGFFQLAGVAPGRYTLRARHPRYSTAQVSPVTVEGREETELEPIELEPPASLEVRITPAKDPFRQRWGLQLRRQSADPSYWDLVAEGVAEETGWWKISGLDRDRYSLRVVDSYKGIWTSRRLDLSAADQIVEISIPRRRLEVDVLLDGEPLVGAEVEIKESPGAAQVRRTTDEKGAVYVFLPLDRRWNIDVTQEPLGVVSRFEELEIPETKIGESWPKLELEIPDTAVEGEVVDAEGRPLGSAADIEIYGGERYFNKWTRADGRFEIRGLLPGETQLVATYQPLEGPELESQVVRVEVVEGSAVGPVRLVLEEKIYLKGMVLSTARHGIPGAKLYAFPEAASGQPLSATVPQAFTDVSGVFDLTLPATTRAVQVLVLPVGFAATRLRVELPTEETVLITVEQEGGTVAVGYEAPPDELLMLNSLFDPLKIGTTLLRDGFLGPGLILQEWSKLNQVQQFRGELTVPMLEPGSYTACFGRDLGRLLSRGSQLPGELMRRRCVSGDLAPFGELYLEIPEEAMEAALKAGG